MNLTFIGTASVGLGIAARFASLGHTLFVAARDPRSESAVKAQAAIPSLRVAPLIEAIEGAEIVFLATPFGAAEEALRGAGAALTGKVILDCTNPVGPGVTHALESRTSGGAHLQRAFPSAHFVKAFSIDGYENFAADPRLVFGQSPVMMIAGNDAAAKASAARLIEEAGWSPMDVGDADAARRLEPQNS